MVSVEEKSRQKIVAGEVQGDERKRTAEEVSKNYRWHQNWGRPKPQDESRGSLLTAWTVPGI